jgi:hypothetical protein
MALPPIPPWAVEASYPAGSNPWSGQPTKVQPVGDYFTPNTKPPAQFVNYELNAITSQLNALGAQSASQGNNWGPEFATSGFAATPQEAGGWDPLLNKYILGTVTVAGTPLVQVWTTYGMDQAATVAWTQIGTNTLTTNGYLYLAVSADPTTAGNYWFAGTDNSGATNNNLVVWLYNGTSWASKLTFPAGTGHTLYGVAMTTLGAYVIVACASSNNSLFECSNNSGSTWTASFTTDALPAGSTWILKRAGAGASTPHVLAAPVASGFYDVWRTTDGVTFSNLSNLSTLLSSGNTIVGLDWGADVLGPCWLAAIQSGSGQPFWARSSDGITWTIQTGGVSTNMVVTDMAACGSLFICQLADASAAGPSGQIFSVDGGITWFFSQANFTSNDTSGTTPGYIPSKIVSSQIGFMALNSLWVRFSTLHGLPPTKL